MLRIHRYRCGSEDGNIEAKCGHYLVERADRGLEPPKAKQGKHRGCQKTYEIAVAVLPSGYFCRENFVRRFLGCLFDA